MGKKKFKFSIKKHSVNNVIQHEKISFGNFGIKSLTNGILMPSNIENLRRKLSKQFKRVSTLTKSKLFFKLSQWKAFTKKPMLSRMGKGSGNVYKWQTFLKAGIVFLEILTTQPFNLTLNIFKRAIKGFPLKLKLIKRA